MVVPTLEIDMATLATKLASSIARTDPADAAIPRLTDDAAYAAAAELLGTLTAGLAAIERDRDRVGLERHFATRAPENDGETDRMLRARLAKLQKDIVAAVPAAPRAAADAPTAAIAAALAVLAGQPVAEPPDHAARVRELDRQHDMVREAIMEQSAVVDTIADEVSFRYAKQLKPSWDALQLRWYRAAQELARVTQQVHEKRSEITSAGIKSRTDVLSMPNVRSPLFLGSETQYDSEIRGWGRILERLGIL